MVLSVESEKHLVHPKYRPDIDGLRAIAVLSVIAFHAFPTLMAGGFVGVDVFFVISGYLISTIIFESLDRNDFSFWEFYGRRVRRIFPALSVVLITSLLLGWLVLVAGEFRQLGRHVVSGAAFVSNFRLWKESGYFDSVAELKPLLHLWSLGIEEQFYIVWPLLLWGTFKYRAIRLPLVVAIAGISFYFNLKYAGSELVAAFYSPLARFWELLVGALIAYAVERGRTLSSTAGHGNGTWTTALISWLGGGLLIAGFIVISKDTIFPGPWALLPTLGAALIIVSGPHEWINRRLLSSRVLVWIGVISFPLYLWHWPLLSFARIVENGLPSLQVRLVAVATAFVLAWGTYEAIEKPLRFGGQGKAKVTSLTLLMCFIAITGVAIGKEYLLPRAHGNPILRNFEFSGYPKPDGEYVDGKYNFGVLGDREPERKVLMLGDSHAQQYRNTFATLLGTSTASIGASRVQVLYNLDYLDPGGLLEAAKRVRDDKSITHVVISKFWALTYGSDKINYAVRCCGNALGGSVGGDAYREPPTAEEMTKIDSKITTAAGLLVDAGKKVYFILDNPFGEELAPQSLVRRSFIRGVEVSINPLRAREARQRAEPARSRIISIAKNVGAEIIDPFEYLCDAEICPVLTSDGIPIYKDYDHLSIDAVTGKVGYLNFLVKE